MDTIPINPINEAIKKGEITYDQCLSIAQALPCFYKVRGVLQPGTDFLSDRLDLSLCTAALNTQGLPSHTVNMNDLPEFPTTKGDPVPELCSSCQVFTPALIKLNQLIQTK